MEQPCTAKVCWYMTFWFFSSRSVGVGDGSSKVFDRWYLFFARPSLVEKKKMPCLSIFF